MDTDDSNLWIQRSMYYSQEPTSYIYNEIVNAETSRDAFHMREKLLGDFSLFEKTFLQPSQHVQAIEGVKGHQKAVEFFGLLSAPHALATSSENASYFESQAGKAVLEHMKDYLFVVIPGFGSHTMQEFSYAYLVEEANRHYKRPLRRPRTKQGDEVFYEDPKIYYGDVAEVGFDVVHPMGDELGNSMGNNVKVADFLASWIRNLPTPYKDKKLILFGYSKGSPIAHHVVQQHEDIRARTRMIVTAAGATQGTSAARSGLEKLEEISKHADGANPSIAQLSMAGPVILEYLLPLFTQQNNFISEEQLKKWERFFDAKSLQDVMDGARSLTPYESIKWNMTNINKENFSNVTIFNISVLTNIQDMLLPGHVSPELGPELPTQLVPTLILDTENSNTPKLVWEQFSLDNVFLYSTSVGGFENSAGGLFDTQVGWMDTKSMGIDFRPLNASLDEEEIRKLGDELGYPVNGKIPRKELIREQVEGLRFVDLGELRGTHWDLAFRQVYKPDKRMSDTHYVHTFPRRSFLRALVETLTLYKIIEEDK